MSISQCDSLIFPLKLISIDTLLFLVFIEELLSVISIAKYLFLEHS